MIGLDDSTALLQKRCSFSFTTEKFPIPKNMKTSTFLIGVALALAVLLNVTVAQNVDSLEELEFNKVLAAADKNVPEKQRPVVSDLENYQSTWRNVRPVSIKDLTDDLDSWVPPPYMANLLTYYMSGYDEEDRPVWVAEVGKWDVRKILDSRDVREIALLDKYARQAVYRIAKSLRNISNTDTPQSEITYLVDTEGLDMTQLGHLPTIAFALRMLTMYRDLIIEHLGATYVINANAFMNLVVGMIRPIFRDAMEKVEILGTNKEKWLPFLRSKIPIDALPPWYGGKSDWKPLAIYG